MQVISHLLSFSMFSLVSLIFMSDASPLKARGVFPEICSTFGQSVTDFAFTMYNNLWNAGAGVGYQCTTLEEVTEDGVRWTTTGSWALNDDQVKSYANVGWKPEPEQLAALSTLPTKWDYTVGCQGTSDVSYDIFTSGAPGGDPAFEVMIWLSKTGPAGPISATGKPIAQHSAAGLSFDLFKGKNQQMTVFSFVASNASDNGHVSFVGDLMKFLGYLIENGHVPRDQYLTSVGAGIEMFVGDKCKLDTASYKVGP